MMSLLKAGDLLRVSEVNARLHRRLLEISRNETAIRLTSTLNSSSCAFISHDPRPGPGPAVVAEHTASSTPLPRTIPTPPSGDAHASAACRRDRPRRRGSPALRRLGLGAWWLSSASLGDVCGHGIEGRSPRWAERVWSAVRVGARSRGACCLSILSCMRSTRLALARWRSIRASAGRPRPGAAPSAERQRASPTTGAAQGCFAWCPGRAAPRAPSGRGRAARRTYEPGPPPRPRDRGRPRDAARVRHGHRAHVVLAEHRREETVGHEREPVLDGRIEVLAEVRRPHGVLGVDCARRLVKRSHDALPGGSS